MKRLIRKADDQAINQLSIDLNSMFQNFDSITQQIDQLKLLIDNIKQEFDNVIQQNNEQFSDSGEQAITASAYSDKVKQKADLAREINNLSSQLQTSTDIRPILENIQRLIGEMQSLNEQKEVKSSLKKQAEFVYCEKCGFDNGDWGYPTEDTVWNTKDELEIENPEHKCPYCGGALGID